MVNSVIIVTYSEELSELKLLPLINRKMIVTEVVKAKNGSVRGCWANLIGEPYMGEKEWYIPVESIFKLSKQNQVND